MADPERVFDGDLLRADLFNPSGRRLFVSFRQRVSVDGVFSRPNPVRSFIAQDHAHLHIQSRFNDWFVNDETAALEHCLADALRGYGRRVLWGFQWGDTPRCGCRGVLTAPRDPCVAASVDPPGRGAVRQAFSRVFP